MCLLLFLNGTPLWANPTGGVVTAGNATINNAGATTTINQSTANAIINWQQFSIASNEATKFFVPNASSATLNRVLGGNPSAIYGALSSNGKLILVNPSGIVIGPGGRVDTASFLGSTLNVSDDDFLKGGDLHFLGGGAGGIDNEGTIHAASGDVYLIAGQVKNGGTISAPHGTAGLAAATDIWYEQAGDQHLYVQATPLAAKRALGVTNSGTIEAATAELKAAGGNAYALAINNTGQIAATGFQKVNGQVYLTAEGGNISNSGVITSRDANGDGGAIVLDASGAVATGNTLMNAGTLDASGFGAGSKGGMVTLKNSTGITNHTGKILARGGMGGAGGNAEISGAQVGFTGTVDLTAPGGSTGTLLLDPSSLDVITGGAGTVVSGQNDGTSSEIDPSVVEGALGTANLTLNADTNITVTDAVTWTSANTLTLSTNTAGSTIDLNAPISGVNGGLTLDTAGAGDAITTGANGSVQVAGFILENGSWSQNSSTLPAFSATQDFELKNGSTFLRAMGGNGLAGLPYLIADVYGLQGIGSPSGNLLGANYALAGNIDATGTTTWNGGAGFVPIGANNGAGTEFSGTFDGQHHAISGLTIDRPNSVYVGLFGYVTSPSVLEDVALTQAQITGEEAVGGLVGGGQSTLIDDCSVSGSVTGQYVVGGLAGALNTSTLENSFSSAQVFGSGYSDGIGGLLGSNSGGTVTDSVATGAVSASGSNVFDVGGLIGDNSGTVTGSHATGSVMGTSPGFVEYVGGLVGYNSGTLQKDYATGDVGGGTDVGGLVGDNFGTVEQTYATGMVQGTQNVGGLVGDNLAPITASFATGTVSGDTNVGGLVGSNQSNGSVETTYATGAVTGTTDAGGLVGQNLGAVETSYWAQDTGLNTGLSGIGAGTVGATNAGATPETIELLENQSTFVPAGTGAPNWDFTNTWTTNGDTTTPQLIGLAPATSGGPDDLLSGTAYLDSGLTLSPGVIIDLLYDGTEIGVTTSDNSGGFSFDLSPADLIGGILLTDAVDHGNTYYEVAAPASTITGVDLYGGYLRVSADTASNTALATTAGSLTNGINYAVTGTQLSTNSGVNLAILSNYAQDGVVANYTVDGDITAGADTLASGVLSTAAQTTLTGSADVTLTGSSVALAGTFNRTGSLTVTSTYGTIDLEGVGTSANPATAAGVTLNGAESVVVNNSYIQTGGNDFSATGTGYASGGDGEDEGGQTFDGLTVSNSTIDAQGGDITLTSYADGMDLGGSSLQAVGGTVTLTSQDAGSGSSLTFDTITADALQVDASDTALGQTGPLDLGSLSVTAGSIDLANTGNNIAALGTITTTGPIDIYTDPGLVLNDPVSGSGAITIESIGGDLTLGPNSSITDTGVGNVTLVTDQYFINNSTAGANAITVDHGTYYIYAGSPDATNLGGLPVNFTQYNSSYPTDPSSLGNGIFYASGGTNGGGYPGAPGNPGGFPPVATGSGPGTGDFGSNQLPPQLIPPIGDLIPPPPFEAETPPYGFGSGEFGGDGGDLGGLAFTSGSGGQIGAGDAAQLNGGHIDNVSNPQASGALDAALSFEVHETLQEALLSVGDLADSFDGTADTTPDANPADGTEIVGDGDVVEIGNGTVKHIPLSSAPQPLQDALGNGVRQGLQGH